MKKSIYLLVAIILSSINFISCQKENEFVTENKNSTFTITSTYGNPIGITITMG